MWSKLLTIYYKIGLVLAMLVYLGLTCSYIDNGHNWGGDFALYISQSKALLVGQTDQLYLASKSSCEHSYYRMNPDLYPPGFPVLLAPVYALFGLNFLFLKGVVIFCFLGSLLLIYTLFKIIAGKIEAIITVSLLGASTVFVQHSNYILADIPAMLWVLLGLYLQVKLPNKTIKQVYLKQVVLAFVCVLAYQTKALSIVLFITLFFYQVVQLFTQLSVKSILILVLTFISINALFVLLYPHAGGGYDAQASTISWQTIQANLQYYKYAPKWFLYNSNLWLWLTLPMLILGIIIHYKTHFIYVLFMFIQLSVLVVWPFQEGVRFILVLIPFYFLFAMLGYRFLANKLIAPHVYKLHAHYVVFVAILAYSLFASYQLVAKQKGSQNEIGSADAKALFTFVDSHTKSTDKLIFFKPNVLRLLAQRESVYLLERNAIAMSKADWWIYKHGDMPADTTGLQPVFTNGTFTVFKLKMK